MRVVARGCRRARASRSHRNKNTSSSPARPSLQPPPAPAPAPVPAPACLPRRHARLLQRKRPVRARRRQLPIGLKAVQAVDGDLAEDAGVGREQGGAEGEEAVQLVLQPCARGVGVGGAAVQLEEVDGADLVWAGGARQGVKNRGE
jgi:hypothetical protein